MNEPLWICPECGTVQQGPRTGPDTCAACKFDDREEFGEFYRANRDHL